MAVIFSIDRHRPTQCRHVTKIPQPQLFLFCILTNCDARNLRRFCSYAICASRTVLRDVRSSSSQSGTHPLPLTHTIPALSFHAVTGTPFLATPLFLWS